MYTISYWFLILWILSSLLSITIKGFEARYCHKGVYNQFSVIDKFNDESFGGGKQKVKLPEDCGRFKGSFSGQHLDFNYPRIHRGYDAKLGQFPSFVELLTVRENSYYTCGGTIITSRHILTAAHCVDGVTTERTKIGFGLKSYPHGIKDLEMGAEKICQSSRYHVKQKHRRLLNDAHGPLAISDVAIIKLNHDIVFNDTIQPACLPMPGYALTRRQHAYSIGSGFTFSTPGNKKFKKANTLKVLPSSRIDCPIDEQHETVMCSKANDLEYMGLICKGDSGGPFMALNADGRQTIYGVHSYGFLYCMELTDEEAKKIKNLDYYYRAASADVHNLRKEIEKLLEDCA